MHRCTFSIFEKNYAKGYAPTLPSMALLREGKVAFMLERLNIEGRDSAAIAEALKEISMLRVYWRKSPSEIGEITHS
jgi:hypothetical protein